MSVPKLPVVLAARARRDFDNLLLYTLQRWGEEQEVIYAAAIRRALIAIGDNPLIGRTREDLRPGMRAFLVERHIIYYQVLPARVKVIRILHGRMNARRAFR